MSLDATDRAILDAIWASGSQHGVALATIAEQVDCEWADVGWLAHRGLVEVRTMGGVSCGTLPERGPIDADDTRTIRLTAVGYARQALEAAS